MNSVNIPLERFKMTAKAHDLAGLRPARNIRRHLKHLPGEGEDGLYTQTWYAVAIADKVKVGEIVGTEFLGGRIAIYRTSDGQAHVVSAYCPHLGARLDKGNIIDGEFIQCPFHFFEFNRHGRCVATSIGAPPPPTANLFVFPSVERFGLIWAFNGTEPLWKLPDFQVPDERLHLEVIEYGISPTDPVVLCCNTPDFHHFRTLHGLDWDHPDPDPQTDFRWTEHSFRYDLVGRHWNARKMEFTFGIYSNSIYFQEGTLDGKWYGYLAPFQLIRPGETKVYFVIATDIGDGSRESRKKAKRWADEVLALECKFVDQDMPILDGIHFKQGALTKKDHALSMYLDLYRRQPRAHPSCDFIS